MLKDSFIHYLLLVNRYINPFGKKSENNTSNHKNVNTFGFIQQKIEFLLTLHQYSARDSVANKKDKVCLHLYKIPKNFGEEVIYMEITLFIHHLGFSSLLLVLQPLLLVSLHFPNLLITLEGPETQFLDLFFSHSLDSHSVLYHLCMIIPQFFSLPRISLLTFRLIHSVTYLASPLGYLIGISKSTSPKLSLFSSLLKLFFPLPHHLSSNCICLVAQAKNIRITFYIFFLYPKCDPCTNLDAQSIFRT